MKDAAKTFIAAAQTYWKLFFKHNAVITIDVFMRTIIILSYPLKLGRNSEHEAI